MLFGRGQFPASGAQLNLPPRPADAPTGSQFISITSRMPRAERENWILAEVTRGNVPTFQRNLVPITVSATINGTPHSGTYYVLPDYLAVGTDADYFLQPMTPLLAQRLANLLGCTLPTRKMVDQIWAASAVKLSPQPIAPSAEMITVPVFAQHNAMVRTQRDQFTNAAPLGALVAGDKKDVIISTKIYTNFANANITHPVVIYGWHYTSGTPIQPLYNGHEETYADYSHGIRLVQAEMLLDGGTQRIGAVLTNASLAPLLSDEGSAEGAAGGVIRVPRYTIAALAPAILKHPRSQTVLPGANAAFAVYASGDPPLGYNWNYTGPALMTASGPTLLLTNLEAGDDGTVSVTVTNSAGSATSRTALLKINTNRHAVVFGDAFETNSSAAWRLFWGSANGLPDYTVDWAYDHSLIPYTFNGVTDLIPPAPNSPGPGARAVRLTVNNNDSNAFTAAVNLYPTAFQMSGDFACKFDMWINYPGSAGGINSTGSTEHAIFGINHAGVRANWAFASATASDGLWFGVDGEGGTTNDYRAYSGNPAGPSTDLTSSLIASNSAAPLFQSLFPPARFETAGSPGKGWVEVEIRQQGDVIYWLLNGTLIGQRANTTPFRSGAIMLGLMDAFSSIANPAQDAFVLFDNLRVEYLDETIRLLSATLLDGHMNLTFSAVPGQPYSVETSPNLEEWTDAATVSATNAPASWTDPAPVQTRSFYRVRKAGP